MGNRTHPRRRVTCRSRPAGVRTTRDDGSRRTHSRPGCRRAARWRPAATTAWTVASWGPCHACTEPATHSSGALSVSSLMEGKKTHTTSAAVVAGEQRPLLTLTDRNGPHTHLRTSRLARPGPPCPSVTPASSCVRRWPTGPASPTRPPIVSLGSFSLAYVRGVVRVCAMVNVVVTCRCRCLLLIS